MEGINLIPAPCVEAQVKVESCRTPVNYVQVREARTFRMLGELRNAKRREDGLVEADTLGVDLGTKINVVKYPKGPVPVLHHAHTETMSQRSCRLKLGVFTVH